MLSSICPLVQKFLTDFRKISKKYCEISLKVWSRNAFVGKKTHIIYITWQRQSYPAIFDTFLLKDKYDSSKSVTHSFLVSCPAPACRSPIRLSKRSTDQLYFVSAVSIVDLSHIYRILFSWPGRQDTAVGIIAVLSFTSRLTGDSKLWASWFVIMVMNMKI